MKREYYSDSIFKFLRSSTEEILGILALNNDFALIQTQRGAWVAQIEILRKILTAHQGSIYLPLSNPKWVMLHSEQPIRHDCTFIL